MPQERAFALGEYVAGVATAILTASAIHAIVTPAWDMALAMLVGGVVGIAIHVGVAVLAGPLLGMFPVMASGSLIGSYGGMIFAMRDSMQGASWARVAAIAALFGFAAVAGVQLYDRALRVAVADPAARDRS
jgi:hypothetical protein